jgi:hypothetical protein
MSTTHETRAASDPIAGHRYAVATVREISCRGLGEEASGPTTRGRGVWRVDDGSDQDVADERSHAESKLDPAATKP